MNFLETVRFKLIKHVESICKHKNSQIFQVKIEEIVCNACIYQSVKLKLEQFLKITNNTID